MRSLVLACFLVAAPATATEIYRWVDADGQSHYSDQWQPGAEKLTIRESVVFSAPKAGSPKGQAAGAPEAAAPAAARYEDLQIVSPAQEEVLWNIEGQLRVSVQVSPGLQQGHALRIYLDGESREVPEGSTDLQLTGVFRGVHTLRAEVADQSGKVLIESPTTSFAVRQTSLANPVRPVRP